MSRPIGVGVIGLGFMGATHLCAYRKADAAGYSNRLVAVSDFDAERRAGLAAGSGNLDTTQGDQRLFDPAEVAAYERPEELLADERVELVSICTPTRTHVELAMQALDAGKHVLLEKPVALSSTEVRRLSEYANTKPTLCMPAMCLRFWPAWSWLKQQIEQGTYGPVRSAVFRRLGSRPGWAAFYADAEQSGGALFDLHIHDADFVHHCFGAPDAVQATGTLDHVTAFYRYTHGPRHVVAEGGWDHSDGFPFQMGFTVIFGQATADFELGRAPELRLSRDGACQAVELSDLDGYDGEVRHLLTAVRNGETRLLASLSDAVLLTEMLECERDSLERAPVNPNAGRNRAG